MTDLEQKKAAKEFAERWKDRGNEKKESQKYWIDLLQNVLGVEKPFEFIEFEDTVHIDKATGFIDGYIPKTKILIEQKSKDKDLRKPIKQSDGGLLKPIQQALKYRNNLPYDKQPRWIITCNFKSFLIYDMNNINAEPEEIFLKDLGKEYYRLSFIVDSKNEHLKKEEELSFKAGEIVGVLYDAFYNQYHDPENEQSQKDLNELCVRIVFCLYSEDAGLFGRKNVFHDYLAKYEDLDLMRKALIDLFKILDTPLNERDPYLEDDLNQFPYVNGGLFSNENIEIPRFTKEIRDTLLAKASDEFDWSEISPTIFGAVFESTLNPETRRTGGMHYTSIENIHKVIDPLFLDELREMLDNALAYKNEKTRNEALDKFQEHIGSLTFFDPACGSGNFLTETYLSLRRLENEAIASKQNGRMAFDFGDVVKVHINQMYGIEINDFAVKVAKTALWIAESQMLEETSKLLSRKLDFLPLKTYDNIYEGNALRTDWNEVVSNTKCNYIMGNPPFVGSSKLLDPQKVDRNSLFDKNGGELDYVACWYKKSYLYIKDTKIECAFVSTNSICQGQQVYPLWKDLMDNGLKINFAYKSFDWTSEASASATVSCVIIGFSLFDRKEKRLYSNNKYEIVKNINAYLIASDNIFIKKQRNPLTSNVPIVIKGFQPTDNGYLILNDDEKNDFIEKEPMASKWIRPFITAKEYVNNINRWCLWLKDISPNELRNLPLIRNRVQACKEWRESQTETGDAYKLRNIPHLMRPSSKFEEDAFIVIPRHTTSSRRYIPFGYIEKGAIPGDSISLMNKAEIYHFGIMESNVHMAWMRTVCGRLGNEYRYTSDIVYNTFVWPNPTQDQKNKIEKTAQMILDARAKYPNSSLADLYDELTMPSELRKAHQENDKAVMEAYGFNWRRMTESECVAELMKMYQQIAKDK